MRTKPAIIAKDNARSIAETLCRDYAAQIKTNLGVSDEDKVRAGVRPINPDREPYAVNMPIHVGHAPVSDSKFSG